MHGGADAAHMRPMARILAFCLLLIGLMAQPIPIAAEAMPAVHDDAAMADMVDCTECPGDRMSGGDACQNAGACASGTAALGIGIADGPFISPIREIRRVFGAAAPTGGRPAPLLEPPRIPV